MSRDNNRAIMGKMKGSLNFSIREGKTKWKEGSRIYRKITKRDLAMKYLLRRSFYGVDVRPLRYLLNIIEGCIVSIQSI